jgi:demethylmenaquinone methyltransferase/2-methoxy-6-polyprenyl-1,4-benzoquinol methylase
VTIWREVENALEAIVDDYFKVNHVISIFQDDKARLKCLGKIRKRSGVSLELGSGPGNYTRMLMFYVEGPIICLDYSAVMLKIGKNANPASNLGFIRGIFEYLPIRKETISLVTAAYAFRDSMEKKRVLNEVASVLKSKGHLLIVDIGKPNNPIIRGFMSLYIRFLVPVLGGLVSGYGYKNPWSILYQTYDLLPINETLKIMIEKYIGYTEIDELAFGGLVIASSKKLL